MESDRTCSEHYISGETTNLSVVPILWACHFSLTSSQYLIIGAHGYTDLKLSTEESGRRTGVFLPYVEWSNAFHETPGA